MQDFLNQEENMGRLNSKSRSQNKKKEKEHDMCNARIQQDFVVRTIQE
jgi:hypothetical protein